MRKPLGTVALAFVVLMALAIPTRVPLLAKASIVWSVAVGLWGIWFWNVFYRH